MASEKILRIKSAKENIIIALLLIIICVQLFLKPEVYITDRDWDIKLELEKLNNNLDSKILNDLKNNKYQCLSYYDTQETLGYSYTGLFQDCVEDRCKTMFYRWDDKFDLVEIK